MKVLLINGSTVKNGCIYTALSEIETVLNRAHIETEVLQLGNQPIRDCTGCGFCRKEGQGYCVFREDIVNAWLDKMKKADGFIFGTPVYYAHPTGQILAFLDRVFYAGRDYFLHKPAAAVTSARRAGTTASIDVLNKYFSNACMPIVSSNYWNMVYGNTPEEVREDAEGLQTMRNLGHNMAWLLKCIKAGAEKGIIRPQMETKSCTNFIR